jgi:nucleoside-diphosphate-sugar epimerase
VSVRARVLITGASGFVGRAVARVLSRRGWSVSGVDRAALAPEGERTEDAPFAQFARVDLLDDDALVALPFESRFDAVVHLAAVLPGQATRADLFAVNVGGTSAVLQRFVRSGGHFVLFSTGLVYGAQPGPFRETMACRPADAYSQSKLAAEALAAAHADAQGVTLSVLRPSVLYGHGAPAGMFIVSLLRSLRRATPFDMTLGEQQRDFLHVDDAARAVAAVLDQRADGTYNLASGVSVTIRQAAELGAAIAGRPELLRLGALSYRANEVFDYRMDASALVRAVGWQPETTLSAGLAALWSSSR